MGNASQQIVKKAWNFAHVPRNDEASCVVYSTRLRQSILKRAFEGKLVPQDPADEPAEELLARIRGEDETQLSSTGSKGKRRRTRTKEDATT